MVGDGMGQQIVSMEHITKEFPGVKALDDVHFELESGEVMALLGENGAGKSTLVKILSGVYTLDKGSLKIFGKDYKSLTPNSAREAGVAIIHQELNMCRDLTVCQNMFLGREIRTGFILNNAKAEQEASGIQAADDRNRKSTIRKCENTDHGRAYLGFDKP